MSGAEGMWKFQSGSVDEPDTPVWGGIIVLESGRLFGGDSVMAYLGTYNVDRGEITAQARVWDWNTEAVIGETENVFGMRSPVDYRVQLLGQLREGMVEGYIWPDDQPHMRLRARMEKIAELP